MAPWINLSLTMLASDCWVLEPPLVIQLPAGARKKAAEHNSSAGPLIPMWEAGMDFLCSVFSWTQP